MDADRGADGALMRAWLQRVAQLVVFALLVRPFLALVMGLAVRHRERLPLRGPALLIANHNSHLDTLALMARLPLAALWRTRPVAAADHFGRGLRGGLARALLRVILIERQGGLQALEPVLRALDRQQIVIFFPEGSRGEPEVLAPFRRGIAHLSACRPEVPVIPVHLRNMGKCMPRGAWLFVPFSCEMHVGLPADLSAVPPTDIPRHLRSLVEGLAGPAALGWDLEEGHGLGEPAIGMALVAGAGPRALQRSHGAPTEPVDSPSTETRPAGVGPVMPWPQFETSGGERGASRLLGFFLRAQLRTTRVPDQRS